ncbi:hypothetical protein [Sandarakinorhabdus sp.]|uniref:hypothetical protein n=1 Tax=Sandarakinorhabdus sp. TaxID=1916663 RepID=UPI003F725DE6
MGKTNFLTRLRLMLNRSAETRTPEPPPVAAPTSPAPNPSRPESLPEFDFADPRIPSASQPRMASIQSLLAEIERQADMTGGGHDALDEARRIGRIFLPELMTSYFDIPPAHRAEIFRRTGKSASFQLNERLDTMIDELRRISAGFAAGQIDSFSVNLKFIDSRFQSPNDPFSVS